jgi:tripartite-type tricarboxylate transporter receptor subunit TctC
LIDAGKVKSLAIMDAKPSTLYPNVPTLKSATGSNWTMAAWRGVLAPKGLPAPIQTRLAEAVRKAVASKDYTDFMTSRGLGVIYGGPDDMAKFMAKSDAEMGVTMKAVGLVK